MKKKVIIIFIVIIFLTILVSTIFILKNKNSNRASSKQNTSNNIVTDNESEDNLNKEITIKSTENNKIEQDGITAEKIDIKVSGGDLEIITTLKNNSSDDLNGFLIEIELLDENGNEVTVITENSKEVVKPNQIIEFFNSVIDLENPERIANARILSLSKNNVDDMFNNMFDEMTPEGLETE